MRENSLSWAKKDASCHGLLLDPLADRVEVVLGFVRLQVGGDDRAGMAQQQDNPRSLLQSFSFMDPAYPLAGLVLGDIGPAIPAGETVSALISLTVIQMRASTHSHSKSAVGSAPISAVDNPVEPLDSDARH